MFTRACKSKLKALGRTPAFKRPKSILVVFAGRQRTAKLYSHQRVTFLLFSQILRGHVHLCGAVFLNGKAASIVITGPASFVKTV
jgi:hypothetical protein